MSQNLGMGSCCLSGKVHEGKPAGRTDEIGGIPTYIAEPKNGSKEKTIIFISDSTLALSLPPTSLLTNPIAVFGWEFTNTRLLADEYAKAGFYCYLPDFHNGDSLPFSFLQNVEPPLKTQETLGVTDKAKNAAIVPATLGPWLATHREGVSRPLIDGFVNTVRMIPGTNKIGALGFCWGGRYAILQAHGQEKTGEGSSIGGVDAAVACHPGLVAIPADFDPVRKPLSLALGTKDSLLDQGSVGQIQDLMGKKTDVPHEIRVSWDSSRLFGNANRLC